MNLKKNVRGKMHTSGDERLQVRGGLRSHVDGVFELFKHHRPLHLQNHSIEIGAIRIIILTVKILIR